MPTTWRIDPAEGLMVTRRQLLAAHRKEYAQIAIEAYWAISCRPLNHHSKAQYWRLDELAAMVLICCRRCGETSHKDADCAFKCKKCKQCGRFGHADVACNGLARDGVRGARRDLAFEKIGEKPRTDEDGLPSRASEWLLSRVDYSRLSRADLRVVMSAEKRIDAEDGRAYTFDESLAYYESKYGKEETEAYWKTCVSESPRREAARLR
mmetsp:Transcript_87376/g.246528  ORF Transcript_87376/g.246528 Transcript_87376/m.246528 type:complete len:209 (-) Transcript_87376:89-715(-)